MKFKSKRSLICIIYILSIVLLAQISTQAAVIDTSAQEPCGTTVLTPEFELPSSYSNSEYATPVKHQLYGDCWAQASLASLEIMLNRDNIYTDHLSSAHMNFATTTKYAPYHPGNRTDYKDGGKPSCAVGYLTSWRGAKTEKDFPETARYEDFAALDASSTTIAGVNSVMYLNGSDRDTIKTAIYKYGSVVGNYYSLGDCYKTITKTDGSKSCSYYYNGDINDVNHTVCIIGWNDSYSRFNFGTGKAGKPKKPGAWLCKNSLGYNWGENGYFWISYEDKNLFKNGHAAYALMDYQQPDDNTKLYQNETYGLTHFYKNNNYNYVTCINVFDFTDEYAVIDKINFEAQGQGSNYYIYYIPIKNDSNPDANKDNWELLYSGKIEYDGYISADIDDYLIEKGKGAIGVKIQNFDSKADVSIGLCRWKTPKPELGKSYIAYDYEENSIDLTAKWLNNNDPQPEVNYFIIKAVVKNNIELVKGDADSDGNLTINDATFIQRYLAEFIDLDKKQLKAADFDDDGLVSVNDVTAIQRHLANFE